MQLKDHKSRNKTLILSKYFKESKIFPCDRNPQLFAL